MKITYSMGSSISNDEIYPISIIYPTLPFIIESVKITKIANYVKNLTISNRNKGKSYDSLSVSAVFSNAKLLESKSNILPLDVTLLKFNSDMRSCIALCILACFTH